MVLNAPLHFYIDALEFFQSLTASLVIMFMVRSELDIEVSYCGINKSLVAEKLWLRHLGIVTLPQNVAPTQQVK